jgi:hypothetical protein
MIYKQKKALLFEKKAKTFTNAIADFLATPRQHQRKFFASLF